MKIEVIASGSAGNCYKVSNEDTTLLIECGIPYKKIQEALNFKTTDIDGVLVSHEHVDHSKACKNLIKAGVDLYMTKGTKEALNLDSHRVKIIEFYSKYINRDMGFFEIGSFKVKAFETVHDAREPVGFIICDSLAKEELVFITDTQYSIYNFSPDYFMIEINYDRETINENPGLNDKLRERIKKNHMSLETAINLLERSDLSRLKKIYVLHLSDANSDAEVIKYRLQELTGVAVEIC
ncbi:MAG: MBL fold metallo-hydrolase [Peptoniphilus grossensis]|uniref:MBL fold metallo-hydrolase n=1 Tax=Peptoniphilus grossensis TaxID=1465756 RepID=UPI002590343B|nr:MBL fold metallo-hydrolase [Peptoniphilus grossensis]MDU5099240.1 MBL fold metallo-hydrolase [Peptoniphilus grossensis]